MNVDVLSVLESKRSLVNPSWTVSRGAAVYPGSGAVVGGARGNGGSGTVRTLVVPHDTPPGP